MRMQTQTLSLLLRGNLHDRITTQHGGLPEALTTKTRVHQLNSNPETPEFALATLFEGNPRVIHNTPTTLVSPSASSRLPIRWLT
jgi:hypothetical protein